MSSRSCSGCGKPGTRVDFCPSCTNGGPRPRYDARARPRVRTTEPASPPPAGTVAKNPTPWRRGASKAPTISVMIAAPPARTGRWTLYFVPFGTEEPYLLDRVSTSEEGIRLAEAHNRLDWTEHDVLGADKLIANGRKGAFILEPELR